MDILDNMDRNRHYITSTGGEGLKHATVPIIWHSGCLLHDTGTGHPERSARCEVILKALPHPKLVMPRHAFIENLELCHTPAYIQLVEREVKEGRSRLSTGDVTISIHSWNAALLAVGSVLTGVDQVINSSSSTVFCLVRPPGHHATSSAGMGFCLFNNVAVGARYAQQQYGVGRVAIIDWDVHHGNGTEELFMNDSSVFYFSTHETPLYPFTGLSSQGNILNCPIMVNKDSPQKVIAAFREKLVPAMDRFKPELIFISAGFDAHIDDPLGHLGLSDNDFLILTGIVKEIALKYANGRIISVLEGGYSLKTLASVVPKHIKALSYKESDESQKQD